MVHHETSGEEQLAITNEAGRLLFAGQCDFIAAANNMKALPPVTLPEICFAGRSNVGKSSLVNGLTGRRMLARTSQTPGRTRQLIFFNLADRLQLVDLPGYGYASAPKTDIKAWTNLTRKYLAGRPSLQRVFLLIDGRHGAKAVDEEIMTLLGRAAVNFQVVITKADKPSSADLARALDATRLVLARHPAAYPEMILTSSEDGEGLDVLRAVIATLD